MYMLTDNFVMNVCVLITEVLFKKNYFLQYTTILDTVLIQYCSSAQQDALLLFVSVELNFHDELE